MLIFFLFVWNVGLAARGGIEFNSRASSHETFFNLRRHFLWASRAASILWNTVVAALSISVFVSRSHPRLGRGCCSASASRHSSSSAFRPSSEERDHWNRHCVEGKL